MVWPEIAAKFALRVRQMQQQAPLNGVAVPIEGSLFEEAPKGGA